MKSKSKRRLTKSASNRVLTGSIGGFGEFLGINANYLRVGFIILTALTHFIPGILIYILLIVIMPADPNKPDFSALFSNFGFNTGNKTETKIKTDRKVIHDVDEHDEK